jgi:hypothetical protein
MLVTRAYKTELDRATRLPETGKSREKGSSPGNRADN